MSNEVFPQEAVGNYFNDKFINVKAQIDTTQNDADEIINWYADAHNLMIKYSVKGYPTFLFFDPNGEVVHRIVGGGEAQQFINWATEALDTSKQYYTFINKYNNGERDPGLLLHAAMVADENGDEVNCAKISADYLKTQNNLFTKENLEFLFRFIKSSKDKNFDIFLKQPQKVDAILGKGKAKEKVKEIAINEEVLPCITNTQHALVDAPNWATLKNNLVKKYPTYADEILLLSKVNFFRLKDDWKNFESSLVPYMNRYAASEDDFQLNEYARNVFLHCNNKNTLQQALKWSARSIKATNTPAYYDTYANILYKLGRKKEAVAMETKAMELAPDNEKKNYQDVIDIEPL